MTPEPASHRVAVLCLGDKFGAIALSIHPGYTVLGIWNPGHGAQRSPCQTPTIGRHLFRSSIKTSEKNGFRVGFLGRPNDAATS